MVTALLFTHVLLALGVLFAGDARAARRASPPRTSVVVTALTSLPVPRDGAAAVAAEGAVVVAGGEGRHDLSGRIELLDVATGRWRLVTDDALPRRGHGAAVVGSTLILVGGATAVGPTDVVELVDLETGAIARGPSLPTPRVRPGVAAVGERVYVAGGHLGFGRVDLVEILDVRQGAWLRGPPLTRGQEPVLVVMGGDLFAVAGPSSAPRHGGSLERLSADGRAFRPVAAIPGGGGFGAAAAVDDRLVLLDAGREGHVLVFEASTGRFRDVPGDVVVQDGAAVTGVAGHVVVTGGIDESGEPSGATWSVRVP